MTVAAQALVDLVVVTVLITCPAMSVLSLPSTRLARNNHLETYFIRLAKWCVRVTGDEAEGNYSSSTVQKMEIEFMALVALYRSFELLSAPLVLEIESNQTAVLDHCYPSYKLP
jgi:hypothetical protein